MATTTITRRNERLPGFPIGASFAYKITLTVDADLPNPSTWDTIRLSVCDGAGAAYFTVNKAAMTVSTTGSGPWVTTLTIPVTEANSRTVSVGDAGPGGVVEKDFSLDYVTSGGYQDVLVEGLVKVWTPHLVLP